MLHLLSYILLMSFLRMHSCPDLQIETAIPQGYRRQRHSTAGAAEAPAASTATCNKCSTTTAPSAPATYRHSECKSAPHTLLLL